MPAQCETGPREHESATTEIAVTVDAPSTTTPTLAAVPSAPPDPAALPLDDALPRALRIEPWADPVIDHLGHDPRSAYVEHFWLPILGPLSTK
jgi:hypothetical protein